MKAKRKIFALWMALALVFTLVPATVFAEGGTSGPAIGTSGCAAHTEHDDACGYKEAVPGAACEHDCAEGECSYVEAVSCGHQHDENCGENGEDCTHDCADGDCGYLEGVDCNHQHDNDCGYREETPEQPCTHTCELCAGQTATATPITVAAFDALAEDVETQGYGEGEIADENGLTLPKTLTGADGESNALTIEGVQWKYTPDKDEENAPADFNPAAAGIYTFTAKLPEGYALGEGVDTPEITVVIRPANGGIMPMSLSDDLAEGTWTGYGHRWVEFGGILWRVLEVKDNDSDADGNKTAFLLTDESMGNKLFHSSGDNDWNGSDIKAWLNDDFLNGFSNDEQAAIVTSNYTYGGTYTGSDISSSSKVFLLSTDEANNTAYFADNADRATGDYWWLRSPGSANGSAAVASDLGTVYGGGNYVDSGYGIRPALKINLASDIFSSKKPLVEAEVTVSSSGSSVSGARISFSGASAPGAKFSNSNGNVTVRLEYGETYTITVSKPGYEVYSNSVTIGQVNQAIPVELTTSTAVLPFAVQFGQKGGSPIKWQVLDVQPDGKALLLADSNLKQDGWQAVTDWINDGGSGGFLTADYFTAGELSAMETYTETGTTMFLLTQEEAMYYMPGAAMRGFAAGSGSYWWLRTELGNSSYRTHNGTGAIDFGTKGGGHDARPAVWIDLDKLYRADVSGDKLEALTAATVAVKAGSDPVNGASVTLTYNGTMPATQTAAGTTIALTGTTAGGTGAAFTLPAGTYNVAVTATGYNDGSGTLTINNSGTGTVTINLTAIPYTLTVHNGTDLTGGGPYTIGEQVQIKADTPVTGKVFDRWTGGDDGIFASGGRTSATTTITMPAANVAVTATYKDATHTITASAGANGSINPTGSVTVNNGENKTFTITANTGYKIYDVKVDGSSVGTVSSYEFTNVTENHTITASFTEDTTDPPAPKYTLTVENGTGGGSYTAGTRVTIVANNPPTGKVFDRWTGGDSMFASGSRTSATTTITMPAANTAVTATYKDSGSNDKGGYTHQTLRHDATGITLTGWFTPGTALNVTKNRLHDAGTCDACDKIRAAGTPVSLYDVSITGSHDGNVELTLPVPEGYNGQQMLVRHCKSSHVEEMTLTASGGFVKGTFSSLSPFAVFAASGTTATAPQTGDGSNMGLWIALLCASVAALGGCGVVLWQRKKRLKQK